MIEGKSGFGGKRLRFAIVVMAGLAALSACARNQAPITPCLGADPAMPRVKDVAPPNCSPLLPGQPQATPAG